MELPCFRQVFVLLVVVASVSQCFDLSGSNSLYGQLSAYNKRSTRFDRMGRYYGKRSSLIGDENTYSNSRNVFTVDEMNQLIAKSPSILDAIIRVYIDVNGDEVIDEVEMTDLRRRIGYK